MENFNNELDKCMEQLKWAREKLIEAQDENRKLKMMVLELTEGKSNGEHP